MIRDLSNTALHMERSHKAMSGALVPCGEPPSSTLSATWQGEPLLYESGALLTRLQADWDKDMWDVSSGEEHAS